MSIDCTLIKSFFLRQRNYFAKILQKRKIFLRFRRVSDRSLVFFMISRSIRRENNPTVFRNIDLLKCLS